MSHHSSHSYSVTYYILYSLLAIRLNRNYQPIYMYPEDMPDAEDFDEDDTWEEGLTELDLERHRSADDDLDLLEDEDDSFVDELDEEE